MSANSQQNKINALQTRLFELEAFFHAAPTGLAVLDDQLCFVNVNRYLAHLNRKSIEDHIGRTPQDIIPDLGREIEADLRQVLATGQPLLDRELNAVARSQPNTIFYGLASYFPTRVEGQTVELGMVLADVTGQKLAEKALLQAKETAEVAVQAKFGFLAGVGHELRTSLNTILGFSKLMGRESIKPAEQRHFAATITRSAEHLLALISDVILDTPNSEAIWVDLPAEVNFQSQIQDDQSDPYRRVLGLKAEQPNYRLLVADDDAVTRQMLVGILQPLGFKVRTVASSRKAIDVWKTWQPQLLFLDMGLRDPSGDELARRIRSAARTPVVLIGLTTGKLDKTLASLFDDMLCKPLAYREILAMLEQHLGAKYDFLDPRESRPAPAVTKEASLPSEPGLAEPLVEAGVTEEVDDRRGEARVDSGQNSFFDSTHVRKQLAEFSPWLVANLHQAIIDLDVERLRGLLHEIRAEDEALAAILSTLVDNFAYDELFSLTTLEGDE